MPDALSPAGVARALAGVAPSLHPVGIETWLRALGPPMRASGIVTARRVAAFFGQCSIESGGFTVLEENLHYRPERLCAVWPSHFTPATAAACAGDPEAIANRAYGGRMGNGPPESGDGWRFRGRGLLQLTGRHTYELLAAGLRRPVDEVTDWLATPPGAAASACWWWTRSQLNALADRWEIDQITRVINGGMVGANARKMACEAALTAALRPSPMQVNG